MQNKNTKAKTKNQVKKSGFTLIELLIVIAIIGILASIVLVSLSSARQKARDSERKIHVREILTALERYHIDNGTFHVPGGHSQSGYGWLNGEDAINYTVSLASVFIDGGYFQDGNVPQDPDPSVAAAGTGYVIEMPGRPGQTDRVCVYARLESLVESGIDGYQEASAESQNIADTIGVTWPMTNLGETLDRNYIQCVDYR